ncbi:hypothetical protein CSE899_03886 [Cronobacter sakazakii E899]|nr:hypothetical protein CSE899_03886 [Cronobacter sakazakii E899]
MIQNKKDELLFSEKIKASDKWLAFTGRWFLV